MEHVGISVDTAEELDAIYERAKAYRQADARVELVDRTMEDYKAVKLHSFYVRYLLPLMFEVQCFDWAEGFSAERTA
jgi:hypothetical protein